MAQSFLVVVKVRKKYQKVPTASAIPERSSSSYDEICSQIPPRGFFADNEGIKFCHKT